MSFYELHVEERNYFYFNHVKKETKTPPHFHGAVEFLFCVDGEQTLSIGGETHTLQKGEGCFVDSYVVHSLQPSGATLYAMVGDTHFFQPVFSAFGDTVPPCYFSFENEQFLSVLYALYQQKKEDAIADSERNKALVKLLLSELYCVVPFVKRKENKQNELVANVLQYASEHYTCDLSLPTIAAQMGYSHIYLSRLLHRYLTMNWNIYVGNLRARAAHEQLQANDGRSVLDVAFACGFDSLNTFYRAYRRMFGKTPHEK